MRFDATPIDARAFKRPESGFGYRAAVEGGAVEFFVPSSTGCIASIAVTER
ncbi:hypothetical protein [Tsukamurella sp. PLM1]|uniref:hypothetical protein n=1 Tax=Tsukamurella sp. PLM1 TaxID=2929795 RepID=UPI00205CD425|nr:hypothetical protein [Tsukamurella sp. PLM1]BDH58691.1 hypothetical protein MTP03_36300 [Tsukamurella sp. PLM1]